jgi:hypothetical protein
MIASEYLLDSPNCTVREIVPAEPRTEIRPREITLLALIELLLKDRRRLSRMLQTGSVSAVLLPRLLAIALAGFVLFGVAMSLVLTTTSRWPSLMRIETWLDVPLQSPLVFNEIESSAGKLAPWISGEAFTLIAAYAFGLVAASGVALPSLYFYCLLAGVRMTMLDVVVHAVKSKSVAAVALVGILPIYVAHALGVVIFSGDEFLVSTTMLLGLVLPFIAGFWGTVSLYQGFA